MRKKNQVVSEVVCPLCFVGIRVQEIEDAICHSSPGWLGHCWLSSLPAVHTEEHHQTSLSQLQFKIIISSANIYDSACKKRILKDDWLFNLMLEVEETEMREINLCMTVDSYSNCVMRIHFTIVSIFLKNFIIKFQRNLSKRNRPAWLKGRIGKEGSLFTKRLKTGFN